MIVAFRGYLFIFVSLNCVVSLAHTSVNISCGLTIFCVLTISWLRNVSLNIKMLKLYIAFRISL